jgi:DNA polymerase-3 subunit delta
MFQTMKKKKFWIMRMFLLKIFYLNHCSKKNKSVVIKRATDKILKIIEILHSKNLEDTKIIINSENLEKKSKLRSFFEKDKKLICVPFYPDNDQTLSKLTYSFFRDKKISISPSNINLIVAKCSGDREALLNEIQKIEYFQ